MLEPFFLLSPLLLLSALVLLLLKCLFRFLFYFLNWTHQPIPSDWLRSYRGLTFNTLFGRHGGTKNEQMHENHHPQNNLCICCYGSMCGSFSFIQFNAKNNPLAHTSHDFRFVCSYFFVCLFVLSVLSFIYCFDLSVAVSLSLAAKVDKKVWFFVICLYFYEQMFLALIEINVKKRLI